MSDATLTACTSCEKELPRSEMFGLEPDLQCPDCAQNIRVRTFVRYRPLAKDRRPIVTVICLLACAVVFLGAMRFGHTPQARLPGWLQPLMQHFPIWRGELWRHVTSMFVHMDWWHILMNGFALWSLGRAFESAYGSLSTAAVILATGAAGGALGWMMNTTPGIGISGALFGLCGFFWAQRRYNAIAAMVMTDRTRNWILTLLVVGVVLSQSGTLPIGNWAHGGGLAIGLLLGWAAGHRRRRLLVPAAALVVVGIVVASMFVSLGSSAWVDPRTGEPISGRALREAYLREAGR